jgi:hypothetical protein
MMSIEIIGIVNVMLRVPDQPIQIEARVQCLHSNGNRELNFARLQISSVLRVLLSHRTTHP